MGPATPGTAIRQIRVDAHPRLVVTRPIVYFNDQMINPRLLARAGPLAGVRRGRPTLSGPCRLREGGCVQSDLFQGLSGFEAFASYIQMQPAEAEARRQALGRSHMPFRVSRFYADLIANSAPSDQAALINIVLPPVGQGRFTGRFDPYGNVHNIVGDQTHLQHKYKRTLLLHITDYCVGHCQFCYKVNEIRNTHNAAGQMGNKVRSAIIYINNDVNIDNVLFTGGDPATVKPERLIHCIESLISIDQISMLRFATKTLSFDPSILLNPKLIQYFADVNSRPGKRMSVIAQINHPAEISEEVVQAVRGLQGAGVLIRGQPAIIAGVNDSAQVIAELHRAYARVNIVPYYFTLFMPVRGVEQYGIPVVKAYRMYKEAVGSLNGPEKKSTFVISHDFGKIEVLDIIDGEQGRQTIVLRWHEVVEQTSLPTELTSAVRCEAGDVFLLDLTNSCYSADHIFAHNGLPFFNSDGNLQTNDKH